MKGALTRTDEDGTPKLVQRLSYRTRTMCWDTTLFNGEKRYFSAFIIEAPLRALRGHWDEAYVDAEKKIEEIVLRCGL